MHPKKKNQQAREKEKRKAHVSDLNNKDRLAIRLNINPNSADASKQKKPALKGAERQRRKKEKLSHGFDTGWLPQASTLQLVPQRRVLHFQLQHTRFEEG